MAAATDLVVLSEGPDPIISVLVTYDDVTGAISRLDWQTGNVLDPVRLTLRQDGKQDISVSIPAGRTGSRTSGFGGWKYNPDGGDGFASIELRGETR